MIFQLSREKEKKLIMSEANETANEAEWFAKKPKKNIEITGFENVFKDFY